MAVWNRIDAADVRLQAARMLESDHLRRAGRLRDMLRFLVEERIAFGDRAITQQRLAEEVLGKDEDFSPTSNAHVRIYLRRLRQRMAGYYAGPGVRDPLVLGVTSGPYRLTVEPRPSANGAARNNGRHSNGAAKKAARRKAKPASLVLMSELSAPGLDGDLKLLPTLVPRALMQHLLGKDGLVAIGPVPRSQLADPPYESPVARSSAAEFLLDGTMSVGPYQADGKRPLEVVVRLHDIDTGKHVWSRTCTEALDAQDLVTTAEMVAARLAAAILAANA